jgi:peptidoglycan-associated lipoprotein
MPRSLRVLSLVLMVATLMTVAGCRKKAPVVVPPPPPPAPPAAVVTPPPPPPPAPQPVVQPPPPAAPTEEEIFARMSLLQLNESRPLDDVFFEFDQSDLSDAGRAVLQKNSTWMKRWTSTRVTIEGHADARGTNEYNLALGERRAAVARDYLISLGIPTGRIDTVSKGEEQQVCREEAESCWAQNRRGHFVITAK